MFFDLLYLQFYVCLSVVFRLDPIISHVPVQELKLSAVRFAVNSEVILSFKELFLDELTNNFQIAKFL